MTGLDTAGVTKALSGASYQPEEAELSFPAIFAQFALAYAARHGDPTDAMARIAVKNHRNALLNPLAHMRKEIEIGRASFRERVCQYVLIPVVVVSFKKKYNTHIH